MVDKQRARNLGSNFSTFRYAGKAIAYLEIVNDSGQQLVAPPQFVQPLGSPHPIEIVSARAIGGGTLTLSIRELWHQEVWQQLAGLAGSTDILQVVNALANQPNYVTCTKIITPPDGRKYGKTYHRCTITDIPDGETITIDTLSVTKNITVAYTHTTPL